VISSVKQDADPSTKVDEAWFFDHFVVSLILRERDLRPKAFRLA
jgi:hypothetical protein